MKSYKDCITLNRNSRGCYIIDTVKGCHSGLVNNKNGCYGECYAFAIAKRYGFNFSVSSIRKFIYNEKQLCFWDFKDSNHLSKMIKKIKSIDMPFIRIGEMGDPSEFWEHTVNICKEISTASKKIVITTKHWNIISVSLLNELSKIDVCINTSISALDTNEQIDIRLKQYERLKKYCNSKLRIVTCDFNLNNEVGKKLNLIQEKLINYSKDYIDTVFRCKKDNYLVTNGIINIEKIKFLKANVWASMFNKNAYFGNCKNCPDQCGIKK